jgi:hypothetical protein
LSLTEAAQVSGYSTDHLSRLHRQGHLRNYGRRRVPRFRAEDLPRKTTVLPSTPSRPMLVGATPRQIARTVVTSGEAR